MSTSGIGGPTPPEELPGISNNSNDKKDINALLHTQVRTLGELKSAMVKYLGKKDGEKLYNTFMQSFGMGMLSQMQQSADEAKKASQKMVKADEQGG